MNILKPSHKDNLLASALTDEQIGRLGVRSVDADEAKLWTGHKRSGLVFVHYGPDGKPYLRSDGKPYCVLKPDDRGDGPKYLSPSNQGLRPYFSRLIDAESWAKIISNSSVPIFETEGQKKGDCGCAHGFATIAFSGVTCWADRTPRPDEVTLPTGSVWDCLDPDEHADLGKQETSRMLPELSVIQYRGRRVYLANDSDVISKPQVRAALKARAIALRGLGAFPLILPIPNEIDGSKNGLDDFIYRHGPQAFKQLIDLAFPALITVDEKARKGESDD